MNRTFRSMASVCSANLVVSLGCASSDATPSDGALPPLRAGQVPPRLADSTHIADVYTPDGEFIERREWPGDISLSLFAATDNSALGVQQDSLGIERVVRMSFRESR